MNKKGLIGPLKAFFIIPSLISIIILATFAYSAFKISEDMQTLLSTQAPNISFNGTHLIMGGFMLKNHGLYPLSLKITFNASVNNSKPEIVSQSIEIPPGTQQQMRNITLHINETMLQSALMNETTLIFGMQFELYIKPLMSITIRNTTIKKIGPLVNISYSISNKIENYNFTHMKMMISYNITNRLPQSINGQVQVNIVKGTEMKTYGYGESTINVPANTIVHGSIPVFIQKSITPGTYNVIITLIINGFKKTNTLSIQIP
jgi:hypothetical protein